jgi:hypothetical protein
MNMPRPPSAKTAKSHRPFRRKMSRSERRNAGSGCGSFGFAGARTSAATSSTAAAAKTGIAANGAYQIISASAEPMIGLSTLPNVFEVSIRPRPSLTCALLLNRSPTSGMTTGAAPAAPMPCRMRPASRYGYGLSSQMMAAVQTAPPMPARARHGRMTRFRPIRSDSQPAGGMKTIAITEKTVMIRLV